MSEPFRKRDEAEAIRDVEFWKQMREEIESLPSEPGKYDVRFRGDPEAFDITYVCEDCGRTIHSRGISFGPLATEFEIAIHKSNDCPAWSNRLWRLRHHHLPQLWWRLTKWWPR